MPENENNLNAEQIVDSVIHDIAYEFNTIVDSVNEGESNFIHDRYFRFAFAEHKSTSKDDVLRQISEYYHHLFLENRKDVPVVAFIVYNGENDWNPLSQGRFVDYPKYYQDIGYPFKVEFLDVGHAIDDAELKDFSPITLVALTAMKYIFDIEKFSISFREAAAHLLKMQNTDEGKDFIKQSLSYFFWKWPYKSEAIKMDSPEAIANKGYETFGEHFFNKGVADTINVFRDLGVSPEKNCRSASPA